MEETKIGIAMFPDGEVIMCPGVIVGRGLGVVRLPGPDEPGLPGYSVTQVATGRRAPDACFHSRALAVRCARELSRMFSFDQATLEEVQTVFGPVWEEMLAPIVERYRDLDDLWINRQEQLNG